MRIFFKYKKSKIALYLFLILNQLIFSANAITFVKGDSINQKNNMKKNNNNIYISNLNKTNNSEQDLINKEAEELASQMTRSDKFSKFWGKLILIFISYTNEDKDKGIDLYKRFIKENRFSGQDLRNEVLSYPWVTYDDWYRMKLVRVLKQIEKDLNE